jgi:acetyl esterase/lipase
MAWFWDQYLPDESQRSEILASPLRATTDELAGLPPAMIINGEADPLRDEGEAYAAKLRAAGVPVTATRYEGIIHDFVMLHPLAETQAAKAATALGLRPPSLSNDLGREAGRTAPRRPLRERGQRGRARFCRVVPCVKASCPRGSATGLVVT